MSASDWTENKIARLVKEGRGAGTGSAYKPWLQAPEVPSLGAATRFYSTKVGRTVHCLSNNELRFALLQDWEEAVVDIREQFPIPRAVTREVAADLAIKHPIYPGTRVETVMTVDFLVTLQRGGQEVLQAYDVKCSDDLQDMRKVEKLEIMRCALESKGVPHVIVCDTAIPRIAADNVQWIQSGAVSPGEVEPAPGFFDDFSARMSLDLRLASGEMRLNDYCADFDGRFSLRPGTGLRLARILMARRELQTDLSQPKLEEAPLRSFFQSADEPACLVAAGGAR